MRATTLLAIGNAAAPMRPPGVPAPRKLQDAEVDAALARYAPGPVSRAWRGDLHVQLQRVSRHHQALQIPRSTCGDLLNPRIFSEGYSRCHRNTALFVLARQVPPSIGFHLS
jgi:hypothetical protein